MSKPTTAVWCPKDGRKVAEVVARAGVLHLETRAGTGRIGPIRSAFEHERNRTLATRDPDPETAEFLDELTELDASELSAEVRAVSWPLDLITQTADELHDVYAADAGPVQPIGTRAVCPKCNAVYLVYVASREPVGIALHAP